jgi:putative ABC transport system substrate-binding protein
VCSCRGRRLLKWRYRLWQRFVRGCAREVILRTATCTFEYRYGDGIRERLPRLAAELVGLPVNLLVTSAGPPALAAKQATKTIPIVFTQVSDPVAEGLVTSLARPGGNITGLSQTSSDLAGKRLELLSETFPKISHVAVLWTSASKAGRTRFQETQSAARALGLQILTVEIHKLDHLDGAFKAATSGRAGALIILQSAFTNTHRNRIIELAAKSRLPTIFEEASHVKAGGFMSYSPSFSDLQHRAAAYVDKILQGAKPTELPVE